MQNSELFRRGVVVPLDDRAEESLRCNNVNTTTQVQYLPITNDSLFEGLWKSGLFHEIYKRCGTQGLRIKTCQVHDPKWAETSEA
jgi:hypothetical protein